MLDKKNKVTKNTDRKDIGKLGMDSTITRRDFVGGTLLGTGAALLTMNAPGMLSTARAQTMSLPLTGLGPDWTGPGGIGDYSTANGDTHVEVNAAHAGVRNREFDKHLKSAIETGETVDLLIVGSGCAGMAAAYYYNKERPDSSVLMLENHGMFGGEARMNELEVDGTHLYAPQGPTAYRINDVQPQLAHELGLPQTMEFGEVTGLSNTDLNIPYDNWAPKYQDRSQADCAYMFGEKMVINPWADNFQRVPLPEKLKHDIMKLENAVVPPYRPDGDVDKWLDSMTYQELLTDVFKADPGVVPYLEKSPVNGGHGLGGDVYSAYLGKYFAQAGARVYTDKPGQHIHVPLKGKHVVELPGGVTGIVRVMASKFNPGLFKSRSLADILMAPINWEMLDSPESAVRIRTGCTVIAARHEGPVDTSKGVVAHYLKDGKLYKVKAKSLIMSTPQQISQRICQDLPPDYRDAMSQFHMAPVLVINVALRNWRFMEKLGISAIRWIDGLGDYGCVTRKVLINGKETMPCNPSKPVVLTFYHAFTITGMDFPQQATAARMQLFGLSYAAIERRIRDQFTKAFSATGFDANRDIAGIITNRLGHALIVSPPGTFFGEDGKPPRAEIIRRGYNRISFAHSDLKGTQEWFGAAAESKRAVGQILSVL